MDRLQAATLKVPLAGFRETEHVALTETEKSNKFLQYVNDER